LFVVGFIQAKFKTHLLDIPNERSSHTQPTPRGGGLGFVIAFAAIGLISSLLQPNSIALSSLSLVLIPLVIIGFIDDRRGVPAPIRYCVQMFAASVAIYNFGAFNFPFLPNLNTLGSTVAIALTIFCITAAINFYNFMDGLDGLVAGCSVVQLAFLGFYLDRPWLFILVAALLGFLCWNWSPAKIFMGDAGSTFLGATIAIALLEGDTKPELAWSGIAICLPLIVDAVYTLVRRLLRKENIFKPHRSHLYQRLQQVGWSHEEVALTYIALNLVIAIAIGCFGLLGALASLIATLICLLTGELYLQKDRFNTIIFSKKH
jgi:UDP-N-acetylmuramyl pentapeptide phosphotransferase/UDP-N-acetylglucosamine-1-phosphate transferase